MYQFQRVNDLHNQRFLKTILFMQEELLSLGKEIKNESEKQIYRCTNFKESN